MVGKGVRRLRNAGKIPAVVYGAGEKGIVLQVAGRDFEKIFREAGESSVVELEIGEERKNVLIHDVARDPVSNTPLHVDFLQVRMDRPIRASIPLVFEGESPAVKNLGGILVKVMHELEVEALPRNLPHEIAVDISKLGELEDKFVVSDLVVNPEVKIIAEGEEVVALIESPRTEEEITAAPEAPSLEAIEVVGKKSREEKEEEQAAPAEAKES